MWTGCGSLGSWDRLYAVGPVSAEWPALSGVLELGKAASLPRALLPWSDKADCLWHRPLPRVVNMPLCVCVCNQECVLCLYLCVYLCLFVCMCV